MTELVYYSDGYKKELECSVIDIRDNALVFDRTIFYPECGGQPGDRGFFNGHEIIDTQKDKDGTPLHIIKDTSCFRVGEKGILKLDWNHRYKFMKEHSAQHLLSALLFHEYGIGTVAVHQGDEILTIETDKPEIDLQTMLSLEDKANDKVRDGLNIYQREMSHIEAEELHMRRSIKVDGEVKVVFIENLDAVACGGVHVANTSEIGEIVYRGYEKIRGHIRTIWSCSSAAVDYRRKNEEIVLYSSRLLSSERENIPSEIERLQKEIYELKKELSEREKAQAAEEFNSHMVTSLEKYIIFTTMLPLDSFQDLVSGSDKEVLILQRGGKQGFLYFGTKERFLELKDIGLKGGGRTSLFRGTYLVDIDELKDKAERIFAK